MRDEDTVTRCEEPELRIVPSLALREGVLQYRDTVGAVRKLRGNSCKRWIP
jgi:hypothetical protein